MFRYILIFIVLCLALTCHGEDKLEVTLEKIGEKYYYIQSSVKASWFNAFVYCTQKGMHLATIQSEEENKKLSEYIVKQVYKDAILWIGGTDLVEEGVWYWLSMGKKVGETFWKHGQPDNDKAEEHCMSLMVEKDRLVWNDLQCGHKFYFICEKIE